MKPEPDYPNSMKESIHAVESALRVITGKSGRGIAKPLAAFEAKMAEVVASDQPFGRRQVTKPEARELFIDDPLKLERLEEFDDDEVITVYENGPFLDLCKGPHIPSTVGLAHFQLLS